MNLTDMRRRDAERHQRSLAPAIHEEPHPPNPYCNCRWCAEARRKARSSAGSGGVGVGRHQVPGEEVPDGPPAP